MLQTNYEIKNKKKIGKLVVAKKYKADKYEK